MLWPFSHSRRVKRAWPLVRESESSAASDAAKAKNESADSARRLAGCPAPEKGFAKTLRGKPQETDAGADRSRRGKRGPLMEATMRVAIYARVSTDDKGQDPENQLTQLREWCCASGHTIVNEYIDYETGRTDKRKEFIRLFEDAHRRQFDLVVFWALDRFSREGMVPTILHLQRLASYGVGFHSYTEAHLATDNELVRNILLALLASLAKVEAQKISERTKAGMARARAKGIRIGRPTLSKDLRSKIVKRVSEVGVYQAARELGVDVKTAMKYS